MSNLQKNGQRLSMADIFLKPAMNRDNLHVMLFSEVAKVKYKCNQAQPRVTEKDPLIYQNCLVSSAPFQRRPG